MIKRVSWSQLKALMNNNSLSCNWIQDDNSYTISVWNGPNEVLTIISTLTPPSADQIDFETNYKANGNKQLSPDSDAFANTNHFVFSGQGISGTAEAETTTNIDYKLTSDKYITGVQLLLKGQQFGDTANFQVVDVDNILGYGANVVLSVFANNWFVADDSQDQGLINLPLRAKINAGLYIRISYNSTGSTNVQLACNLFLQQKTS